LDLEGWLHYIGDMKKILTAAALAAVFAMSSPALATGASAFTIVNGAGAKIESLTIRRVGTEAWKPLAGSPSEGARQKVDFSDPDCAFDIQAKLTGGATAVWTGVNLCEVNAVVLNRTASGAPWVDYQ
jgi:hypothetical protein